MQRYIKDILDFLQSESSKADLVNFIIVVFVGLLVAFIANKLLRKYLLNVLRPVKWLPAEQVAAAVRFLASGLIVVYFLKHALDAFKKLPPWLWEWKTESMPWLNGLIFFIFGLKAVDVLIEFVRMRLTESSTDIDESIIDFLGKFLKVVIVIAIALVILENLGFKTTTILTSMGFLGAAVALSFQSTLGNIIAFFSIVSERLFKVGDYISTGDLEGFVVRRGLRSITLQALNGAKITVPNKSIVDMQIKNSSKSKTTSVILKFGITYDNNRSSIEKALSILKSIFSETSYIKEHSVSFINFGDSTLDLLAIIWVENKELGVLNIDRTDLNLRIKEKFDEAGIEFAFPTSTIYVKKDA